MHPLQKKLNFVAWISDLDSRSTFLPISDMEHFLSASEQPQRTQAVGCFLSFTEKHDRARGMCKTHAGSPTQDDQKDASRKLRFFAFREQSTHSLAHTHTDQKAPLGEKTLFHLRWRRLWKEFSARVRCAAASHGLLTHG